MTSLQHHPGCHPAKLARFVATAFLWLALCPLLLAWEDPLRQLTPAEMAEVTEDAYVYAYPLVTMEIARRVMTNVEAPQGDRAPLGSFAHSRDRLGNGRKGPINPDLLFSTAWLDLRGEPYVLTIPDVKQNYFLLTMLDGWTNVFGSLNAPKPGEKGAPKQGEKGKPQKREILITGPDWYGNIPAGMREYKCVTDFAWLIAQFGVNDAKTKEIHALQDQLILIPLSKYENAFLYISKPRPVDPGIDMATPIREQVNNLSPAAFFGILADLLKTNYPVSDGGIFQKLKRIGFIVGDDFNLNLYQNDPDELLKPVFAAQAAEIYKAFSEAPKKGMERIKEHFFKTLPKNSGWVYSTQTGGCGTNYAQRAAIAYYGLGAGRAADFFTAETQIDSQGRPLEGRYRYRVHLGSAPPVEAFWTLGVVDHSGNLVPNNARRYTLGSRKKIDGPVDLLVQRGWPGGGNWLPSPEGRFALVLRLYRPLPGARDGSWKFPIVERIE